MNDYFLRCQQSEVTALLAMGAALGVVVQTTNDDGTPGAWFATNGGALDIIGTKYRNGAPVVDSTGAPYWHANLRTDADLAALAAMSMHPDVVAALASLPSWFVTGADGKPTAPVIPARVWF